MKGYLLLSVHRTGSYWLCSLANDTERMGRANEWLKPSFLQIRPSSYSPEAFFDLVIEKASTENGRFGVKIFPEHLKWVKAQYGFDFIAECRERYETRIIYLERRDRLSQALSFARGRMTRQWKSTSSTRGDEAYDFAAICRAYFDIERSYAFWRAYFTLQNLDRAEFFYEDLLPDPMPYLHALAAHLCVQAPVQQRTDLVIQRDSLTEEWLARFKDDLGSRSVLEAYTPGQGRGLKSLGRLLRGYRFAKP